MQEAGPCMKMEASEEFTEKLVYDSGQPQWEEMT